MKGIACIGGWGGGMGFFYDQFLSVGFRHVESRYDEISHVYVILSLDK